MERNISCKVHFISHTQSALMPSIIFYYYDIALQFFFSILLIPLCTMHSYIFLSFFTSFVLFCRNTIECLFSSFVPMRYSFAFFNLKKTACNNIHEKNPKYEFYCKIFSLNNVIWKFKLIF